MKEKLYTIPVNDAFDSECECPICAMRRELETQSVEYTMGPSYMEEDIRAKTDQMGFCSRHMQQIYEQKNMLGMALILKTHISQTRRDLEKLTKETAKPAALFKKPERSPASVYVEKLQNSCFICDRINQVFNRYISTIFHLYRTDQGFQEKYRSSKGFCTEHYGMLLDQAQRELKGDTYLSFVQDTTRLYLENMKRVEDDLEWFINKFDYRYQNEPWKNSRDAVPRAMTKTAGILPPEKEEK